MIEIAASKEGLQAAGCLPGNEGRFAVSMEFGRPGATRQERDAGDRPEGDGVVGYCGSVKRCSPGVWLGLLLAPLLHAQMTVQVTHTPTQAVLSYVAPSDSLPCHVQISQSRRMTPLVPDVNPNLFEGADLDSRSGSISIGEWRTFVAGARRADVAADGRRYSRALQAATLHFYRVSCGEEIASGEFTTDNPPLGNNYPELPPFDSQAFGNYAWPTMDWGNASQGYVDPLTGILLK